MLFGGEQDQKPHSAGWLEKYQINLDVDILPAKDTWKFSAPAYTVTHKIWQ